MNTIEKTKIIVAKVFGITVAQLESKNRATGICDARSVCCSIMSDKLDVTQEEIGKSLNIDHASVIYNKKKALDLYATEQAYREKSATCLVKVIEMLSDPNKMEVELLTEQRNKLLKILGIHCYKHHFFKSQSGLQTESEVVERKSAKSGMDSCIKAIETIDLKISEL